MKKQNKVVLEGNVLDVKNGTSQSGNQYTMFRLDVPKDEDNKRLNIKCITWKKLDIEDGDYIQLNGELVANNFQKKDTAEWVNTFQIQVSSYRRVEEQKEQEEIETQEPKQETKKETKPNKEVPTGMEWMKDID